MGIRALHCAHGSLSTPRASAQFRVRVNRSCEQAALIVVNNVSKRARYILLWLSYHRYALIRSIVSSFSWLLLGVHRKLLRGTSPSTQSALTVIAIRDRKSLLSSTIRKDEKEVELTRMSPTRFVGSEGVERLLKLRDTWLESCCQRHVM